MPNAIDITGRRFGRFVAIKPVKRRIRCWLCRCDCGAYRVIPTSNLQNGNSKSCGCSGHGFARHGKEHPLYWTWLAMHKRCSNPNHPTYKNYGARGIKVCKRWSDFTKFLADVGERPPGLVMDRINNNGNYTPKNVRWTTWSVSNKNQRRWK